MTTAAIGAIQRASLACALPVTLWLGLVVLHAQTPADGRSAPEQQPLRVAVDGIGSADLRIEFDAGFEERRRVIDVSTAALRLLISWFGPPAPRELKIVGRRWSHAPAQRPLPADDIIVQHRWLSPRSDFALERQVIVALARAYWRSIRHSDARWRWFEEGLARYSAARAINEVLDPRFVPHRQVLRLFGGHVPYPLRTVAWSRSRRDSRPPLQTYPEFESEHGSVEPSSTSLSDRAQRSAAGLLTQERMIGWAAMQQALATFAARHQLREPTPADLAQIFNEQRGIDLTQPFIEGTTSSAAVDYRVEALTSKPLDDGRFETKVWLGRAGDALLISVPVAIQFASGVDMRAAWDGSVATSELTVESTSPAVSARIDPDALLMVDANRQNNVRVLEGNDTPIASKAAWRWFLWLQDCMLSYASLL